MTLLDRRPVLKGVGLAGAIMAGGTVFDPTFRSAIGLGNTHQSSSTMSQQPTQAGQMAKNGKNQFIPTPIGDPADQQTVSMAMTVNGGHYFIPNIVWVTKGGTVTWVNSTGGHTASAYSKKNGKSSRIPKGAKSFNSGMVKKKDATFKHTFNTPGIYDYYCKPHEPLGMVGKVIVGAPSNLQNAPALQTPSSLPSAGKAIMKRLNSRTKNIIKMAKKNKHIKFTSNGDVKVVG